MRFRARDGGLKGGEKYRAEIAGSAKDLQMVAVSRSQ